MQKLLRFNKLTACLHSRSQADKQKAKLNEDKQLACRNPAVFACLRFCQHCCIIYVIISKPGRIPCLLSPCIKLFAASSLLGGFKLEKTSTKITTPKRVPTSFKDSDNIRFLVNGHSNIYV